MEAAPAATASVETDTTTESDLHRAADSAPPPPTARTPAKTDETVAEVLELEQEIMQDGSEFGRALRDVLQDALPIVRSDLNLVGWLRVLSEETDRGHCQPAAELYLRLSRGWLVLPADTVVEPQWTRNYQSALEAEQDVTAEISRLHQKGFLLTFAEAQQRFPSLRQQSRPDVVLAMGCVIKQSAGRRKVRITLDASAPHDGSSLNARIECPPTKLASVRQARAGLAELTADGDEVWMFTADLVDAYLQNPCAEESVNHLGIEWKGEVYVYVRMPFGVSSAPAAQQTLLCALMRAVMRRWTRAGIVCGSMPGYDHHQDWPGAQPRAAAVVSSQEEAQTTPPAPILRSRRGIGPRSGGVSWSARLCTQSGPPPKYDRTPIITKESVATALRECGSLRAALRATALVDNDRSLTLDPEPEVQPAGPPPCFLLNGFASTDDSTESSTAATDAAVEAKDQMEATVRDTHTKCVQAHSYGYLDDVLGLIRGTKALADKAYALFLEVCAELGLQVQDNPEKTSPPARICTFLGVVWDSIKRELRLSEERVAKMVTRLEALAGSDWVTLKELQSIVGVLQYASCVIPAAVPYYRRLLDAQRGFRTAQRRPSLRLKVTPEMTEDIDMWLRMLRVLNNAPVSMGITQPACSVRLWTDAAFTGWGYWFGSRYRSGSWPSSWRSRFKDEGDWEITIAELEAWALLIALRDIIGLVPNRRLTCMIDNQSVVGMCRRLSSRSPRCLPIMKEIALLCAIYQVTLRPIYVPSKDNTAADQLSRKSQVRPADLQATLAEWATREPDATWWSRREPVRPELRSLLERAVFD